jgi:uncharacterized membrane protein YczE
MTALDTMFFAMGLTILCKTILIPKEGSAMHSPRQDKAKRYLVFLIGLFVNAFGVSFVTKSALGSSPISVIPYVLSLRFSPTLGQFTILFSVLLILLQILILRKNFRLEDLIQLPVSIVFGYFIDFTMYLLQALDPTLYVMKLLSLLVGCIILGFGVYLEVIADVAMLPGESLVRAIVRTWNKNFGNVKITIDATYTILAALLSVLFFAGLQGVREGTILAALLVGQFAKIFGRKLVPLTQRIFPSPEGQEA